ncbi:MAG: hypothetical protein OER43_18265 [Gammaproteobacteria bacterium]|nr:hypothetical protein [Gammaproteobacteria bacterium]
MLKNIMTLTAVSLALLFSNSVFAQRMEYLGPHSGDPSTFVTANRGIFIFNELCSAAFPGSQMCESIHVLRSGATNVGDPDNAQWIKPTLVASYLNAEGEPVFVDASGKIQEGVGGFSCNGWFGGDNVRPGLIIGGTGKFGTASCNLELPVACCKAVFPRPRISSE